MKGDAKSLSFVEDTAVAPEKLRDYIERFLQVVRRHGTVAGVYAHASVGCLHVRPVVNLKTEEGVRRFEAIANDIADLVLEFGGALSGEHGDGLVRGPFTEKMFGPVLYDAFRTVKRTFDPDGRLQPRQDRRHAAAHGESAVRRRLPDAGPADLLRLLRARRHGARGRDVQRPRRVPENAGRDDVPVLHGDARGKAFDARAAPTRCGWRWPAGWASRASAITTSTTCSTSASSAGPARPNARWASTWRGSRASSSPATGSATACRSGTRVIGHIHALSKWGSALAPLSNLVAQSGIGRWLNEQLLGIDRRRTPPSFARDTFAHRFARRTINHSPSVISHQPSAISHDKRQVSSCSTTPSPTTTIPRLASRLRRCSMRPESASGWRRIVVAADR